MAVLQKAFKKDWPFVAQRLGRGNRGQDPFLQPGQHVSTTSLNALPHRWPTSGQIPIIAGRQCRSPQIHSQASVSLLARPHPLPLLLPARLLLPQFLLLFLLFLLNPRPPGAEWLVGTREAFRIIRFIKIIGLICIIRIISTISQYLISSGPARRPLRAPGHQGPKNGHFTIGGQ